MIITQHVLSSLLKNPKVDNYSEFVISLVLGDEKTSNVVQPNKAGSSEMSNVSSEILAMCLTL